MQTTQPLGGTILCKFEFLSFECGKIINTDLKLYEMNDKMFGLAQIEVGNLVELGARVKEISIGLEELCESKNLEFAILMVTDVVRSTSRLVLAGNRAILKDLPYNQLADCTLKLQVL